MFISHVHEGFSEVLDEKTKETSGGNQDQGFFIKDIDFLGNQESSKTSAQSNKTSLGN